jgi:acid phosphatase
VGLAVKESEPERVPGPRTELYESDGLMLRPLLKLAAAAAALSMLAACGSSSTPLAAAAPEVAAPASVARSTASAYTTKFVQLVIFENEGYGEIVGNSQAPYITSLAKKWANMTQSYAVAHPSQPNYLALFSGSTQGVTSDDCPYTFHAPNLGEQLIKAGMKFTGYAESMPSNGFTGCYADPDNLPSGYLYFRKHVPWPNFPNVPAADSIVYPGPLKSVSSQFTWITPNMCDDMHDCSVAMGDSWASKNLPDLIAWDKANDGVLILTFDEDDGSEGNHITTILAGNVNPGQYSQQITHYNVLRTIEAIFGLAPIANAKSAKPIAKVVK